MAEKQPTIESLIADSEHLQPSIDAEAAAKRQKALEANKGENEKEKSRIQEIFDRYKESFKSQGIALSLKSENVPRSSQGMPDDYNNYYIVMEKNGVIQEVALPGFTENGFTIRSTNPSIGSGTELILQAILKGVEKGQVETKELDSGRIGKDFYIAGEKVEGLGFGMKANHQDAKATLDRWGSPNGYFTWIEGLKSSIESIRNAN